MYEQENQRLAQLENRVRDLETEVRSLREAKTPWAARTSADDLAAMPPPPMAGTQSAPGPPPLLYSPPDQTQLDQTQPAQRAPRPELDSEAVLKWGGIALVVLAVGFALSTAIQRGWIGPELQLLGAMLLGGALIAAGVRVQPTRPHWTAALCSGGVLTFFTTFGSSLFVDLVGTNAGLVLTVIVMFGGYGLARFINSEWVGLATAGGGIAGGVALQVWDSPVVLAILWGLIILGPGLALALERGWHGLRLASFIGLAAWFAGISHLADDTGSQMVLLIALAIVALAVLYLPSIGNLQTAWQQLEVQGAGAVAPWLLLCIGLGLELDGEPAWRYLALVVTVAVAFLAFVMRQYVKPAHFVSTLVGASVTLSVALGAFVAAEYTFLGLAVQGAGLLLLRRYLGNSVRVLVNALVLLVISSGWVAVLMLEAWTDNVTIGNDALHLATIAALAAAVYIMQERELRYIGAFGLLGLALAWLGSVLVHLPQGHAAVSLSWAAVGTALLVGGGYFRRPLVGGTGLGVLALTVAKLLTIDLASVDALWRAGLFLIVGLGLLRLGFSLPKLMGIEQPGEARQGAALGGDDQLAQEPR